MATHRKLGIWGGLLIAVLAIGLWGLVSMPSRSDEIKSVDCGEGAIRSLVISPDYPDVCVAQCLVGGDDSKIVVIDRRRMKITHEITSDDKDSVVIGFIASSQIVVRTAHEVRAIDIRTGDNRPIAARIEESILFGALESEIGPLLLVLQNRIIVLRLSEVDRMYEPDVIIPCMATRSDVIGFVDNSKRLLKLSPASGDVAVYDASNGQLLEGGNIFNIINRGDSSHLTLVTSAVIDNSHGLCALAMNSQRVSVVRTTPLRMVADFNTAPPYSPSSMLAAANGKRLFAICGYTNAFAVQLLRLDETNVITGGPWTDVRSVAPINSGRVIKCAVFANNGKEVLAGSSDSQVIFLPVNSSRN